MSSCVMCTCSESCDDVVLRDQLSDKQLYVEL